MTASIKITALTDIGANIAYTSLVPVVNMAGTPVTQKANLQIVGNLILNGAGGSYFPPAAQAVLAQTVVNAAQPNITSVGTLNSLTVTGNMTTGNIIGGNLISATFFSGDGGFLSNVTGGNAIPGGSNTQVQFNDEGNFGGEGNFTYDSGNHVLSITRANASYLTAYESIDGGNSVVANYFIGDGSQLTGITANANTGNITFNGDNIGSTNDTVNIVGNNYAQLQSANTYMWVEDGEADIQVNGNTWVFNDSGYMEIPNEGSFGALNSSILAFSSQNNKPIFIEVIDTGNSAARQWVFDNEGNLTLPANTFAVNYANGSAVTIPTVGNIATLNLDGSNSNVLYGNGVFAAVTGGGANTGNVTFDDINVIGTGNLNLQPDSANASDYLDIYLTGAADIHIASGGGSGNVILGTDEEANVAVLQGGNVAIQAGNVSGTKTWTFDTSGDLTLPGSLKFPSNYSIGPGEGSLAILSPDSVAIIADQGNTDQLWLFGADGTTRFPTLTVDLHNGGNQTAQTLQFGNPGQQAIITGPTPEENYSAERIIIQGQRGNGTGEGGDVYVWGGDADTNGGDIKIYAGDADNVSTGSGGYVNLAGGDGFDNGGAIDITGGSSANGTGGAVYIDAGSGELDGGTVTIQGGYGVTGQGGTVQITGGASGNGTGSYGNVVLGSGSIQWIFDNTGNLTLPANTFAVNYANGDQVSIGGGGNTGNVTFDDINIIGTGNLKLQPDSANASAYLDIYLTGGPDIHIAGNGETVILGTDDYANVAINIDGNVSIQAGNVGGTQTWNFGTDGNLTLPSGGDILVDNGRIISADNEDFQIIVQDSNDDGYRLDLVVTDGTDHATRVEVDRDGVEIVTNLLDVANQRNWRFKTDGTTEFPDYTISQYSSLKIKSGNPSSSTAIWTFGDDGNLTLPDTTSVLANVSITLEANDTGNITGLNLIGDYYANLYAHGNVMIVSDSSNTTPTWTFDTTGNLSLPEGGSIYSEGFTPSGNPGNTITLNPHGSGSITNQKLLVYPTAGDGDHIHLTSGNLYQTELFLGSDNLFVKLSNTGNIVINSDDNAGNTAQWKFGIDGNLTASGNLIIAGNTDVGGTNAALIQPNPGLPLIALSSGANGGGATVWVEDIGNVGTSNIAAVYANPTPGSKIVRIAVGQNGSPGPNLWDFDTTGNLTLPTGGHIIVSGGIVGGGASPAPYISGFDSIGALEFTNGNSNVTVTANATSWTFGTDGLLTLPEGGIVTNNIPTATFDILYQYDDLEWDGITVTFTNASSTYMLGVLALMLAGDPITLVGPGGPISTTVAIPYTGGSAGYFTVTEANSPIQITQFTLPNRLPSVTGIKLTTNAKNYLFTEAGVTQSPVLTVDTLPSGQYAVAGFRAFVSDANLAPVGNFGAIVGNSGSNTVCVWCDGTNWRIG